MDAAIPQLAVEAVETVLWRRMQSMQRRMLLQELVARVSIETAAVAVAAQNRSIEDELMEVVSGKLIELMSGQDRGGGRQQRRRGVGSEEEGENFEDMRKLSIRN